MIFYLIVEPASPKIRRCWIPTPRCSSSTGAAAADVVEAVAVVAVAAVAEWQW